MKKYKIGYTTGVFDLFHIGHLNILRCAKERCEVLVVGVSTDELVESYKGKRPIICFEDRKQIVESIRYVDKVFPQENMDKLFAWQQLHFDVLFHGDDWKDTPMYNKLIDDFKLVGVDVVFLPHTPGVSSTLLTKVLHDLYDK